MLGIVSVFLLFAETTGTLALIAMLGAIVLFVIGLLMGKDDESEHMDKKLPQKTCPACKKTHDFDYPKCPFCGHEYK